MLKILFTINPLLWLIPIPFIEVATTVFLTKTFGAAITYSLFAVSNVIGLVILWFQWKTVKPYWDTMLSMNQLDEEEKARFSNDPEFHTKVAKFVQFIMSVVLLVIPGFVTDLISYYLMYAVSRSTDNAAPQINQGDS
jgi:UPF0716 family protein affecting phage T7 exclusion